MSENYFNVHTIPVPAGWSVEQAWEAISRNDKLPPAAWWANVAVREGRLLAVLASK